MRRTALGRQPQETDRPSVYRHSATGLYTSLNTVKARASASDGVRGGPYPRDHAAVNIVTSGPAFLQGIALVLCGDLDGADVSLRDGVSVEEDTGAHGDRVAALSEQSLLAMARSDWGRAEVLAGQAPFCARPESRKATQRPCQFYRKLGCLLPAPRAGLLEG